MEELMKVLEQLEERDRNLIRMRYIDGCTLNETAEALGMTSAETSRRERVLLVFIQKQMRK